MLALLLFALVITTTNVKSEVINEIPRKENLWAIKAIEDWMERMSEMRTLSSCENFEPPFAEPFIPNSLGPVLFTRLCQENDTLTPRLSVKGGIVDDQGRIQGMAKLQLDQTPTHPKVCVYRRQTFGSIIKTLTGTFVDGVPNGNVKTVNQDLHITIGNYLNGTAHGLVRRWNAKNNLTFVGYVYNSKYHGKAWVKIGDGDFAWRYQFFQVGVTFGDWREDASKVLAFGNKGQVVVGTPTSTSHYVNMVNTYHAKIKKVQELHCFLNLDFETLPNEPFRFQLDVGKISEVHDNIEACHQGLELNTKNPIESFRNWLQDLNGKDGKGSIWKLKASNEDLLKDAPKFIQDISHVSGLTFACALFGSKDRVNFTIEYGHVDLMNRLQGNVKLVFNETQTPKMAFFDQGFKSLFGYMKDTKFQEEVGLELIDGRILTIKIRDGVLHGLGILLGRRPVMPLAPELGTPVPNYDALYQSVSGVFAYRNGHLTKSIVLVLIGGGMLVGDLDSNFKFTGDNLAFVYPDFELAYVGRFENFVMKRGRIAEVVGEQFNEFGIKQLKFSFRKSDSHVFFYSPPTNVSMGEGPKILDPYDQRTVKLGPSTIEEAGEGVFAIRKIPAFSSACMFSGINLRNLEEIQLYLLAYKNHIPIMKRSESMGSNYNCFRYNNFKFRLKWT